MKNQLLDDALRLWAGNEQNSIQIGYPREAAFAKNYMAGYRQNSRVLTEREIDALTLVERGVAKLRLKSDFRYYSLREYYGAYPNPRPKKDRMIQAFRKIGKGKFYDNLKQATAYLECLLDTRD